MLCERHCDSLERKGADSSDTARLQADREANRAAVAAVQKGVVVCSSLVPAISRKRFNCTNLSRRFTRKDERKKEDFLSETKVVPIQ